MKGGAVEFLTKPLSDETLLAVIRYALERSRASLRQEAQTQILRDRYASLTPREREVLASIVGGRLNKQIGAELGISEFTVKAHRGRMLQKMQADSLAALVRMATKLGFAPTSKR
jgi:FixJ family two-component response regulator